MPFRSGVNASLHHIQPHQCSAQCLAPQGGFVPARDRRADRSQQSDGLEGPQRPGKATYLLLCLQGAWNVVCCLLLPPPLLACNDHGDTDALTINDSLSVNPGHTACVHCLTATSLLTRGTAGDGRCVRLQQRQGGHRVKGRHAARLGHQRAVSAACGCCWQITPSLVHVSAHSSMHDLFARRTQTNARGNLSARACLAPI